MIAMVFAAATPETSVDRRAAVAMTSAKNLISEFS
jgi:hypothetical protein